MERTVPPEQECRTGSLHDGSMMVDPLGSGETSSLSSEVYCSNRLAAFSPALIAVRLGES